MRYKRIACLGSIGMGALAWSNGVATIEATRQAEQQMQLACGRLDAQYRSAYPGYGRGFCIKADGSLWAVPASFKQ